ncbi:hypothetical protein HPB50_006472 [Hyalomma asiaticum]|uniref:Uncharacterized protein n=1 Tax=Hyalomma asiaticum TaxID=266040 RepID=A0ACB7T5T4_HYAAI|nr:hypothetical protein HPB50_006472 [Hyalomma asiaticum]
MDSVKLVDGVPMLTHISEENFLSAMKYQPRDDDVIVVTYPKCGTKWTQYIVSNILTKGNAPQDLVEFLLFAPFIDMMGAEAAASPARKGPLATHIPLSKMVFSKKAKYIYVARNPYDCCVSFYHFRKGVTASRADSSFDTFLSAFLSGRYAYGDYFDHVLPWYGLRNEANVLFFTYEQLRQDTESMIVTIADFLGAEHGSALREDKELLRKILEACTLQKMKAVFNVSPRDMAEKFTQLPPERYLKSIEASTGRKHDRSGFVRKGAVGDWRSHFTLPQITAMKTWIGEKTQGSDVMDLWKDVYLP